VRRLESNSLAHSLSFCTLIPLRHPGDVSDFDDYCSHLPEQWCPMVTIIGSVGTRSDGEPELRHFELQTSVYDTTKAAPVQFSVVCFFQNNRRWENVKVPVSGSFVSVTGKVVGRTTGTNCLALRVLDLAFLSKTSATATTPASASTSTPTLKRSNRWGGRVDSSKKMRRSEPSVDDLEEEPITIADTPTHSQPAIENEASSSDVRPQRRHLLPKKYQS
jgi:hypothetical protein